MNLFDDLHTAKRFKVCATYIFLVSANLAAWAWAFAAFHDRPALLGTALLAYTFGLRHAFDADHIAAIDNVVRRLMQDGKHPFAVGFFFSLGHSTIVVLASTMIAATAATLKGQLDQFHDVGGVLGTLISAAFLLMIGFANLVILHGIWVAFMKARHGEQISDADLENLLAGRGFLARIFRPTFRLVSRSWHMYAIGLLFGLGFDTATEIGLLGISASQSTAGLSLWTILVFPALFTAGMSLMDTTDSVLMAGAYGWALVKPVRKLWYNLTMTATSIAVALFVGGLEALGLLGSKGNFNGPFWDAVGALNGNLASFGLVVVGIFILSWAVSTALYRQNRFDAVDAS